jgi:hypothetical protein
MDLGGYFKLNYHRLLMAIGGCSMNGYWCIFYWWILVVINGYYIYGY